MLFSKDHLKGYYEWVTETERYLFSGSPTRRLFNNNNGDQMLLIINSFAALSENFSIEEGRDVENLINNHLPLTVQSELTVFRWLQYKAPKV